MVLRASVFSIYSCTQASAFSTKRRRLAPVLKECDRSRGSDLQSLSVSRGSGLPPSASLLMLDADWRSYGGVRQMMCLWSSALPLVNLLSMQA
jgi:hypothetical protein